jgi:hypothetical protein
MAKDELTGNMPTEKLISYFNQLILISKRHQQVLVQ